MYASIVSPLALLAVWLLSGTANALAGADGNAGKGLLRLPVAPAADSKPFSVVKSGSRDWLVDNSSLITINDNLSGQSWARTTPDEAEDPHSDAAAEAAFAVSDDLAKRGFDTINNIPWRPPPAQLDVNDLPGMAQGSKQAASHKVASSPQPRPSTSRPSSRRNVIRQFFDIQDPATKDWHTFVVRTRPLSRLDPNKLDDSLALSRLIALLNSEERWADSQMKQQPEPQLAVRGTYNHTLNDGWAISCKVTAAKVLPLLLLREMMRVFASDPKYATIGEAAINVYMFSSSAAIAGAAMIGGKRKAEEHVSGGITKSRSQAELRVERLIRRSLSKERMFPSSSASTSSSTSTSSSSSSSTTSSSTSSATSESVGSSPTGSPQKFGQSPEFLGSNPFFDGANAAGEQIGDQIGAYWGQGPPPRNPVETRPRMLGRKDEL